MVSFRAHPPRPVPNRVPSSSPASPRIPAPSRTASPSPNAPRCPNRLAENPSSEPPASRRGSSKARDRFGARRDVAATTKSIKSSASRLLFRATPRHFRNAKRLVIGRSMSRLCRPGTLANASTTCVLLSTRRSVASPDKPTPSDPTRTCDVCDPISVRASTMDPPMDPSDPTRPWLPPLVGSRPRPKSPSPRSASELLAKSPPEEDTPESDLP
mmetsp:Transcript_3554/g.14336  ORF Transcript_3554/g.14336 Transcript_3554/m.14336 type:complete len:214 (+) Transcript_3554:35-676(+)